jgi:SPASM domain peptide maturase of grasp-with-spasm system
MYRHIDKYLSLFTDVIPVRGLQQATLNDLTRNKVEIIPNSYFDLINEFRQNQVNVVYDAYNENSKKEITKFIDFIINGEYGDFFNNNKNFPEIEEKWDSFNLLESVIVDIGDDTSEIESIFVQIAKLNVAYVQVRAYSNGFSLKDFSKQLTIFHETTIEGVELLLKFDKKYSVSDYVKFFEDNIIIAAMIIHSAKADKKMDVHFGYEGNDKKIKNSIKREIKFIKQKINSEKFCGIISKKYFCVNNVRDFMHNKLCNSCLNRKISIDIDGNIKNCPSMQNVFGNVKNTALEDMLNHPEFKELWHITKDQIDVCKDCEFRYICTDCRAFLENPENIYSKPLKCGYNPETCEWKDWSTDSLKQKAIKYYDLS